MPAVTVSLWILQARVFCPGKKKKEKEEKRVMTYKIEYRPSKGWQSRTGLW